MIETTRCIIQSVDMMNDLREIQELYLDEKVRAYLGGPRHVDRLPHSEMHWTVRHKLEEGLIGLISIGPYHDGINNELSYQFRPECWGKGYAFESIQAVLEYALIDLKFTQIFAETQAANQHSCRLLEKLGMIKHDTIIRFGAKQAVYSIESR
ncbi:GNAT family N-acetyltransferase [Cytobacillus purgationiresistens]|uniref:Ribosomal-protein-alanine N-acetyltransferase n=1 Tax=Cytobacillus purgationiresistens TaxID=863449 RepID=A0ABU0APN2_9BACI|nr:GNAT family N-acetyltransferase [Cytobacillus purgationiresistens]MDQ0273160.1 ribosomal-protein-alanine N-acetyltransferase [Cytobacillus purgationiresistens]